MVIENADQYHVVLEELTRLVSDDPDINTPEADRLNELTEALLVYEHINFNL